MESPRVLPHTEARMDNNRSLVATDRVNLVANARRALVSAVNRGLVSYSEIAHHHQTVDS